MALEGSRRMRWLGLSVLVLAACQLTHNTTVSNCDGICGRRPLASSHNLLRITGGSNVLPGTWPWMVSIQAKARANFYYHVCGGSLISPQWVLSAAHCFSKTKEKYKLVLGSNRLTNPGPEAEQRSVRTLVKHEKYANRLKQGEVVFADIALLEMDRPINCSDYIQPACLPEETTEIWTLGHCYISGWGRYQATNPTPRDIMQEGPTGIYTRRKCSVEWGRRIPPQNICAGDEEGKIAICRGDSGGPLMCREKRSERYWVIGVTSFAPLYCGTVKAPSVFISTQFFLDWIQMNSKLQHSASKPTALLAHSQITTPSKPRTLPTMARLQWNMRPPSQVQTTRSPFPFWMRDNFWSNWRPGRRPRYGYDLHGPWMAPRSQFKDPLGYYPGSEDYSDLLLPSGELD